MGKPAEYTEDNRPRCCEACAFCLNHQAYQEDPVEYWCTFGTGLTIPVYPKPYDRAFAEEYHRQKDDLVEKFYDAKEGDDLADREVSPWAICPNWK